MQNVMVKPWDWRKSQGGWSRPIDSGPRGRAFHAYDVNDNAACDVSLGLIRSIEEPNEGSHCCPDCIEFVQANPAGRDKRTYPSE